MLLGGKLAQRYQSRRPCRFEQFPAIQSLVKSGRPVDALDGDETGHVLDNRRTRYEAVTPRRARRAAQQALPVGSVLQHGAENDQVETLVEAGIVAMPDYIGVHLAAFRDNRVKIPAVKVHGDTRQHRPADRVEVAETATIIQDPDRLPVAG